MSAPAFPFLPAATNALLRLRASLVSTTSIEYLLAEIGWDADLDPTHLEPIHQALGLLEDLQAIVRQVARLRQQEDDPLAALEELVPALQAFFTKVKQLGVPPASLGVPPPFDQAAFWQALVSDLPPYLLATALQAVSPVAYGLLLLTGVLVAEAQQPTASGRLPYTRYSLHWAALGDFLSHPVQALATRYGWGAGQTLAYQRVLGDLLQIAQLFPVRARPSLPPAAIATRYYTEAELAAQHLRSLILPLYSGALVEGTGIVELGLSLTPIPAPTSAGAALSHTAPAGFLLAPYLYGTGRRSLELQKGVTLEFTGALASDDAIGIEVLPGAVHLHQNVASTAFAAAINLIGAPAKPIRFFGTDTTSRVELTGYALSVGLSGTVASPELLLRAGTALAGGAGRLLVYLEPGDGDSFIARAFGPDPIKLEIGGALTWSSRTGLGIDGAVGLHVRRAPNKTVGPLTLHDYTVDIAGQTGAPLTAAVSLGGSLKIGPVTATVEDIGVNFKLSSPAAGTKGLFDDLHVEWGFKGPTGIGLAVDSEVVTGGGYLLLDPGHHKYGGVAQLKIKLGGDRAIELTALGILQTELPGNPDAYSLVLLIAATFTPIQLGLGFTLNGLGGLVGLNRRADTECLLKQVKAGEIQRLLFPQDVRTNPAAALDLVEHAYPAKEGRYLIGLAARLAWGTPSLITLDLALIVELPAPVRLLLLGRLQAQLQEQSREIFLLQADFLGYVDFGARKASFDASLTNSRLLVFTLTGDLAFRYYQGDNPVFLLTAGGFHPQFQPPAGAALGSLSRLRLALNAGDDLRISLASYFALTSNTVQFGANFDLYLRLAAGLHVDGHLGFDALFQFSPFHLETHADASVAIRRGDTELLSLGLSLNVSGPQPWHIWGEAYFRLLGLKVSVDVNATLGSASGQQDLAAPDVQAKLVAALGDAASWEVEAPPTRAQPGGVTLRPVVPAAGQLFIDPRGALVLRQRVVPLQLDIQKLGSSPVAPINGRYFELLDLTIGGQAVGTQADVRDFFARDQVQKLAEADRLSLPSFERFACGRRLSGLSCLTAGANLTRRVVIYEQHPAGGPRRRLTGGKMGTDQFDRLAQGGALGAATMAARPSARAPQPVGWADSTYAIVQAATLRPYGTGHDAYPTQAEAEQARQQLLATAPAAELLVVAGYELALA